MPSNKAAVVQNLKVLAPLTNDNNFAEALGDLADAEAAGSPELNQAMADPAGYFTNRGIELPPNATVQITANSPVSIKICIRSVCVTIAF
jgi:hypothetical protein